MANDNIFGQFSTGVTNNQMSESVDGSQGVISGITNKVLNVDSNLGKSLNEYAAKMFDANITDLSKGIGSFKEILKVVLTGETALLYGVKPPQAQVAKVMGQNMNVAGIGAR